jgi:bifunctional oligoribonuclease and PAP phosphatase NrnA
MTTSIDSEPAWVATPGTEPERIAILEQLRESHKLIVVTHERPDGDALGSLIAMRLVLTALGKDCLMFIADQELPLPYEYRFLPLDGLISTRPDDADERVAVFVDCGNIDRNPAAQSLRPDGGWPLLLNIDHHHDNTRFGDANYVDASASCTAEMIWGMMHELGVPLTHELAAAMYVGLITDTGCFMYGNTGPRAHYMAAEMIIAGLDVHAIYQQVYEGVPFGKLALLAKGLQRTERYDDGRLTISELTVEDFHSADAEESYCEGVIDHLRAVRGTAMAALVRDRVSAPGEAAENDNGARVRKLSLRATDTRVDVSAIARELGGGGHPAAAGATTSLSWEDLVAFLRKRLAQQLQDQ